MTTVFVLLLAFLLIGLCASRFDGRVRFSLAAVIIAMLLFLYLT